MRHTDFFRHFPNFSSNCFCCILHFPNFHWFFFLFFSCVCGNRGNSLRRFKNGSKWRTKEISIDGKPPTFSSSSAAAAAAANRNSANISTTELSPALLAQANWTFVEKLLKVSVDFHTKFQIQHKIFINLLVIFPHFMRSQHWLINRIVNPKQSVCYLKRWAPKRLHWA